MLNEKIYLFDFFDFFCINPKDNSFVQPQYAVSANGSNLDLILIWILGLTIIIINAYCKKSIKTHLKTIVLLCLTIFCFVGYFSPNSQPAHNTDPIKGISSDMWYYTDTDFEDYNKLHLQHNEESDFKITEYDLNLIINSNLKAKATITIDNPSLKQYKFTLYRGYKIESICDQNGNSLKFEQKGDYVTITPKGKTNKITFIYHGSHPIYYSNSQGINLRGGFAYYPINGFRYIFNLGQQGLISNIFDEDIPITAKVDCKNKVFSNLTECENNTFKGYSNAITLLSGFYKEITVENTRIVYGYLNTVDTPETKIEAIAKSYIDKHKEYQGKTIMLIPSSYSLADATCKSEYSDHIVANGIGNAFNYEYMDKNYETHLDLYYKFLEYYDEGSRLHKLCQLSYKEIPNNSEDLEAVLARKILLYGDDVVYNIVSNKNTDFNDNMTLIDEANSIIPNDENEYEYE